MPSELGLYCGETYKNQNEVEYTPSISVTQLKGDVNDDGVVDVADVVTLRRYLAGGYNTVVNELQSDMNDDGEITISDIIELRRYIVNN